MSLNTEFEYTAQKQPSSLDMYVEKLKGMNERTLIKYSSRWGLLINSKYVNSKDESLVLRLDELVTNIIKSTTNNEIKSSTFRQYRASVCYGLAITSILLTKQEIDESDLEAGLSYQLLNNLYKTIISYQIDYSDQSGIIPDRTSALKKKSFPEPFFLYLKSLADVNNAFRFNLILDFVQANLIVGLRPIEWLNVRITSDIKTKCLVLFVENAKNSFGRANGDVRELRLLNIIDEDIKKVLKFYISFQNRLTTSVSNFMEKQKRYLAETTTKEIATQSSLKYVLDDYEPTYLNTPKSEICDQYEVPQNGLAELVLNSMQGGLFILYNQYLNGEEDINSKRVTLYSTRHQCIANAKSSKVNIYEIAAFFGHSSTETSSRHYGKAWSGWSLFTYKPSLESILKVNGSSSYLESEYGYVQKDKAQSIEYAAKSNSNDDFNFKLI